MMKRSSKKTTEKSRDHSKKEPISSKLDEAIDTVKEKLGNSEDVIIRPFTLGKKQHKLCLFYMDGMCDSSAISNFVMETLMVDIRENDLEQILDHDHSLIRTIHSQALTVGNTKIINDYNQFFHYLLSGNCLILIEGSQEGLMLDLRQMKTRSVEEPSSQTVIRGPRDGFTESISTNITLIRRRLKDTNLWLTMHQIGKRTQTDVGVMYIQGIANPKVVKEVEQRLQRIEIDGILESGYIEELIQDETFTPFPTMYHTERPDMVCAQLLEGRIAILVDGTPFVLIAPALFAGFFQASEDYYTRSDIASLTRMLRYISFMIALLGPSIYIALTTYHQEIIPTTLLISLASQRANTPLPAFIEALMMATTFEILREAGLRMPRTVGQTISIVGAIVIGQAAVQAGIVSPAMVIVVAITGISSYTQPSYDMVNVTRILRFLMMAISAAFGLFGITVGLIILVLHMCSLRSFGVPYLFPFAPMNIEGQKDAFVRVPWWAMFSRPRLISQKNVNREDNPPTPKPEPDARHDSQKGDAKKK